MLKTYDLTKLYKDTIALNKFNITIESGQIYGLVGENGSGKTTLMRIITGLIYANSGHYQLLGTEASSTYSEALKNVGCIIETPKFYPNLTAEENLGYFIRLYKSNNKDIKSIKDTLELVGLEDTKKKKAKNFSLGMKQKLGIAIALINKPKFLILDEPINGLDPIGIKQFRNLIKLLNKEQKITILISSHILSELYQVATHYGFIYKGQLIHQISHNELANIHISKYVEVLDIKGAMSALKSSKIKYDIKDNTLILSNTLDNNIILDLLKPFSIQNITNSQENLEDYYFNLIKNYSKR